MRNQASPVTGGALEHLILVVETRILISITSGTYNFSSSVTAYINETLNQDEVYDASST